MVTDKAMKAMVMLTQRRKGQLMHIPVTLGMEIIHSRHLDLGAVGWFHIQHNTSMVGKFSMVLYSWCYLLSVLCFFCSVAYVSFTLKLFPFRLWYYLCYYLVFIIDALPLFTHCSFDHI